MQEEVADLDSKVNECVEERTKEFVQQAQACGFLTDPNITEEETNRIFTRCLLHEVSNTLTHRKQLEARIAEYEPQIRALEYDLSHFHHKEIQKQQQRSFNNNLVHVSAAKPLTTSMSPKSAALHKKERTIHRSRSTEWPEIPEVDLIVEKNPEVLAQKILEAGKKIEQNAPTVVASNRNVSNSKQPGSNETANKKLNLPCNNNNNMKIANSELAVGTPKVSFFEDHLHNLITTCLQEDGNSIANNQRRPLTVNSSSISPRAFSNHTSPVAKTSPRPSPTSQSTAERKKKIQLSPDITSPYPGQQPYTRVNAGTPGKTALRAHLISSQEKDGRKDIAGQLQLQQQYMNSGSRTIGDFVNGVVESLAGGSKSDLSNMKSPPIRTNLYSPISRPNSSENIPEAVNASVQSNANNNYQERASVLVSTKTSTGNGEIVETKQQQPREQMDGLALRYISSVNKNPTLLGSQKSQQADLLNSAMVKGKKFVENSSGRVVTEVVLGNPDEESYFEDSGKNQGSSSVLRVIRKRISDLPNVS